MIDKLNDFASVARKLKNNIFNIKLLSHFFIRFLYFLSWI